MSEMISPEQSAKNNLKTRIKEYGVEHYQVTELSPERLELFRERAKNSPHLKILGATE